MIRRKTLTSTPKSPIFIHSKVENLQFDGEVFFKFVRYFLKLL